VIPVPYGRRVSRANVCSPAPDQRRPADSTFSTVMHGAVPDWTPTRQSGSTRLPVHTRAD
jgi:hypothetical protein